LPIATANNIATTLRIRGTLQQLIKGWNRARCVNFDAGLAKGPWGSEYFIEGFGIGLFAEVLQANEKHNGNLVGSGKPASVNHSALSMLKKQLQHSPAKEMRVRLDGKDFDGRYVVLEVLNIRCIGPNLNLAPQADINDGFLDVVFVSKRERAMLSRYLTDLKKRKIARPNLTIRRGRHLQIEWENSPVHIDDTPWPEEDDEIPVRSNAIDVRVQPAALVFLVPSTARRGR
ncbi:MAG TPA: hypothetical protein VE689_05715, partial [Candidatus Udaeobacter sp.]|nr:hypothetical protein [Candidatus Udaeobacter sp.]